VGSDKLNKLKVKKLLFSILILFLLIVGILLYVNWAITPIPEGKRNISNTDVKMLIDIADVANRTPIIRTYTKEEFDSFNENELKKIKDLVSGNIEGDVPTLKIENGKGIFKISFEKNEKNGEEIEVKIIPDDIPKIKIFALETLYSPKEPREINDSLIESEEEGIYLYELKKYSNSAQVYGDEEDGFFLEAMFIEIYYEVDKESYVSIFAINTSDYKS